MKTIFAAIIIATMTLSTVAIMAESNKQLISAMHESVALDNRLPQVKFGQDVNQQFMVVCEDGNGVYTKTYVSNAIDYPLEELLCNPDYK